jgi:phytoene dehydrogenase-like protein
LKAALCWMAAQSGPPSTEPLTAPFLLWHPLYHVGGIGRPEGGSGVLTAALKRHVESHGGEVHLQAPVEEILVEGRRAVGVRVRGEVYTSRSVLAGTHVGESLGRLLPPEHRPESLRNVRVGNGFGAILRLALSEPVAYADGASAEARRALQLLCRDRQQISDAYADYLKGHPTEDPPIVAMTFSAVDSTLTPPGGEVLWLWAQYYPYALRDGRGWDEQARGVAERILDAFERYAPGTRDKVVGGLFQHPVWLERGLGLPRGNVMHLEMSLDQMFALRPSLTLSQYKTHLDRLFITGASTHPGGGIMGASGRNAARQILKALDRLRFI